MASRITKSLNLEPLIDLHLTEEPVPAELKKEYIAKGYIKKNGDITPEGESAARQYAQHKHKSEWS